MKLGYIAVDLDAEQQAELIEALKRIGVKHIDKYAYHCTLMYDEREQELPRTDVNRDRVFTAHVSGVKHLGDALAFTLNSKELLDEFDRLKAAGYQHSYPDILLHMSLTYDFDDYDRIKVEHHLTDWIGRELKFTKETLSNLED